MIKIGNNYRDLEPIGKGLWIGELPKVMGRGIAIASWRFTGGWQISLPKRTPKGEYWYQEIDGSGNWQWNHGIVNEKGKIVQIG